MRASNTAGRRFLPLLLASIAACSASNGTAPSPSPESPRLTGDLLIEVVPTSEEISVGVSITIEGRGISVSRRSMSVRLNDLAPGSYRIQVALSESALAKSQCSIREESQKTAAVVAGETTTVVFRIYCPKTVPR